MGELKSLSLAWPNRALDGSVPSPSFPFASFFFECIVEHSIVGQKRGCTDLRDTRRGEAEEGWWVYKGAAEPRTWGLNDVRSHTHTPTSLNRANLGDVDGVRALEAISHFCPYPAV